MALVVGLALVFGVGLFLWLRSGGPDASPTRPNGPGMGVGVAVHIADQVCAECHPGEAALHARSGHSQTLRPAYLAPIAKQLDGKTFPDPDEPDATWTYRLVDDRFEVERREEDRTWRLPIDYAFGSDHHATTFVTLQHGPGGAHALFEHRLTHFGSTKRMGLTPGQEATSKLPARGPLGRQGDPVEASHCFACHATRTSPRGRRDLDPAGLVPSISCESCHGPGGAHVDAARAGARDHAVTLELRPGRHKAETQMRVCGTCHRHPDMSPTGAIRPDNIDIVRFQPVGLMQSKCYQESAGALSCVTCHDPHARTSAEMTTYEQACLKCHGGTVQSTCRVSTREGCVKCHMPAVEAIPGTFFTDHWVRKRGAGP